MLIWPIRSVPTKGVWGAVEPLEEADHIQCTNEYWV